MSHENDLLSSYRQAINEIDEQLYQLYKKRFEFSRKVGAYKHERGLQIFDKQREAEILERLHQRFSADVDVNALEYLHEAMMFVSRNAQYYYTENDATAIDSIDYQGAKVGFQGVVGSFSSIAAQKYFKGIDVDYFSYNRFEEVFEAVANETIDYAVLPLENSSQGEVSQVFDLLRDFNLHIIGEMIIPIRHHLITLPDAQIDDIRKVYSHPQALSQSYKFLSTLPDAQLLAHENTALSAKLVRDLGDKSVAAVASSEAAETYGLKVLAADIHDYTQNKTRFIVIARKQHILPNANKTSILVTVDHRSGALAQVVEQFKYQKVNMVKITSRPIPDREWNYQFFIDFDGSIEDVSIQRLLYRLETETVEARVFGSYPKGEILE